MCSNTAYSEYGLVCVFNVWHHHHPHCTPQQRWACCIFILLLACEYAMCLDSKLRTQMPHTHTISWLFFPSDPKLSFCVCTVHCTQCTQCTDICLSVCRTCRRHVGKAYTHTKTPIQSALPTYSATSVLRVVVWVLMLPTYVWVLNFAFLYVCVHTLCA